MFAFSKQNVVPNATRSCGPYNPANKSDGISIENRNIFDEFNHDTIGMIAIDSRGRIAGGTSTNGAAHKIPGFVIFVFIWLIWKCISSALNPALHGV